MKLLLLHGPAISSSRTKLNQLKKSFSEESLTQFPEGSSVQDILGSLQTLPMFDQERLIIVENPPDDLFSYNYTLNPVPCTLILWFDHEVSEKKEILKYVKEKGEILFFPEGKEVSVFPFLDFLGAKDKKVFFELQKLKQVGLDSQYLITMMFYLLRSLVAPKKNAPEFVKRKIAKQKQNFSEEDIKNLYKFILETDFKIKNGLIDTDQAEFSLVSKFIAS